jgi:hypothetical protein
MKIWTGLAFLLAATAAHAQTYTTVVNPDTKTITTTGPDLDRHHRANRAHWNRGDLLHDRYSQQLSADGALSGLILSGRSRSGAAMCLDRRFPRGKRVKTC